MAPRAIEPANQRGKVRWPQAAAGDYATLKSQLNLLIRLIEHTRLLAENKSHYAQRIGRIVPELILQIDQIGMSISNQRRRKGQTGEGMGYWVNDLVDSVDYFGARIEAWAIEAAELARKKSWKRAISTLDFMRQAAGQILSGYTDDANNWHDGLLSGPPPRREVEAPANFVTDSLWKAAQTYLEQEFSLIDSVEALINKRQEKQKTRLPAKRKPRPARQTGKRRQQQPRGKD